MESFFFIALGELDFTNFVPFSMKDKPKIFNEKKILA